MHALIIHMFIPACPHRESQECGNLALANLTNNKDIFMCIIRFHARAGYIQHYETLLKEINSHPGSEKVPPDRYEVETAALADRSFNVLCESGIRHCHAQLAGHALDTIGTSKM